MQRHQLVWLDEFGWYRILAATTAAVEGATDPAVDCIDHWARQRWPLVVTRQVALAADAAGDEQLALALPAPARFERRRIALRAPRASVQRCGRFPPAGEIGSQLATAARADWERLCRHWAAIGVDARVYGSHGWQRLTGSCYVHADSDIDLLLAVDSAEQADCACAHLQAPSTALPRLDGELEFADGAAVAWREWLRWRAGLTEQLLVKRRSGAKLESGTDWIVAR